MLQSDFSSLTGGDGWGRRALDKLERENRPYDWINRALIVFIILCVVGAISFGSVMLAG